MMGRTALPMMLLACAEGTNADSGSVDAAATAATNVAVADCILGWWIGTDTSCEANVCWTNETPECSKPDCVATGVHGFNRDVESAQLITLSRAERTFSTGTRNPMAPMEWAIVDGGMSSEGGEPRPVRCSPDEFWRNGHTYRRPEPAMVEVLGDPSEPPLWRETRY